MTSITLCEGSSILGTDILFLPENGSKTGFRNIVLILKKIKTNELQKKILGL